MRYVILFLLINYFSVGQEFEINSKTLDEIVLTGQYLPTHVDSSIYAVEIINKNEINLFSSQNLSSVLNRQLGITIFHDQFLGDYLDFQGFSGQNIKVLIDGIEVPGLYNGTFDFSQIMLNNIDKIEIIEGPLSTVYGNNALGGTINLISKENQNEKIDLSIESYLESIGQYNLVSNLNYKIFDNLLSLSFGRNYFDGWSENNDFKLFSSSYMADSSRFQNWKPKEQFFLNTYYSYKTKNNLIIRPYLDLLDEEIVNKGYPRGSFLDYAFDEYYFTKRIRTGILIKGPFLNRNINVILNHHKYDRSKIKYRKDLITLEQILTDDNDSTTINFFNHRITCSNIQNQKVNYQYGYEINYENINTLRVVENEQKRTVFSFFSSFDFNYNNIDFRTAFRYLYSDENENAFTPSFNLKFELNDGSIFTKNLIRLSYSNGFRIPSLKEMYFNFVDINHNIQGNSELNSETSKNIQLNFDTQLFDYSQFNCKFFYNRIDGFITLIQNENTSNFEYINIGNYNTLGSKVILNSKFNNLDLNFNFSYLASSSIYDSELNFYPTFNSSFIYSFNLRHNFSIFYSFKGSRTLMSKNLYGEIVSKDIDPYHTLDFVYNTYFFDGLLTFSVGCNNIFNIKNIDSETLVSGFHNNETGQIPISCGRYIFTSLKINFKYD